MAGGKMRADQLEAVWFAAGTAAFMACVERAVVVSLFAQWRVWEFLALNLLLLAILFTSKSQTQSTESSTLLDDGDKSEFSSINSKHPDEFAPPVAGGGDEEHGKEKAHEQISKEELNERVEAFIAMFRQHLVSDERNFRTSRPSYFHTINVN